ncbi:LPS export ABC transporter periplasmic protein LptC [Nonlabens sp. Ci31]|uniref:LPS export ABC transporter periplasmic protein LptC n=1 Tax=Nonlabens sp. Ci31 TaxID=2608253 RepID=UPI0014633A8B|nr:LPS export ABC transporter periplasmic protein LptC [Nonlabens sp. Ci31]QJP33370.1 LPS export ABC transporter periplasmic protein LptC [Nonlabens sp. Ci31]
MRSYFHILKITITALAVIYFLASCDNNLKEIQKMEIASNEPASEGENMLLKHTDSGKLKLTLQGKKMLDFSNDEFPYTQFPDGIKVEVYEYRNNQTEVTTITANAGTLYDKTNLVDLKGNVKIITSDGNTFTGEQLYWDQTAKWIFTNQPPFEIVLKDPKTKEEVGRITATVLDASEDLKIYQARNPDDTFISKSKQ